MATAEFSPPLVSALESGTLLILLSQDCDIAHSSYEAEPYIELLVARPVPQEQHEGGLFHGKNPRRLQFTTTVERRDQLYSVNIIEKTRLNRQILLQGLPDGRIQIDAATIDLLARWTGKRYTRPAFPDEFNERCRPAAKRVNARLKAKGHLITGLFLQLDSYEELPPRQDYRIILRATALPETCDDLEQERVVLSLISDIEKALNDCAGVMVAEVALDSERDLSLYELRFVRRWDYDFLSYREDTPKNLAPDE